MKNYLDEQGVAYLWGKMKALTGSKVWVGATPPPDDSYELWIKSLPTLYAHSPNVRDDGVIVGAYGNNLNYAEVFTIPGVERLKVELKYSTESTSYDWICVWAGSHSDYTPSANYDSAITPEGMTSPKIGGGSSNNGFNKSTTIYVEGDSVTIGMKSDSSGGYAGYHATISATRSFEWGDETTIGDAAWWSGLKTWVLNATTAERQACVGKKKKVSLSTAVLGANAASMICIGADQDGIGTLTFQTEGLLPTATEFSSSSALWNGSTVQSLCNNFGNYCSASASLKSITKLTSSTCDGDRTNPADVVTTAKCWLPSEQEMGLNGFSPSRLECTQGTTNTGYSYYTSNERRKKYVMNADGSLSTSTALYWERSRYYGTSYSNNVCFIYNSGSAGWGGYNNTYRLAPAFVIG